MPKVKLAARFFLIPLFFAGFLAGAELRLGIVGGDGADAIAFTRILNDVSDPDHAPGARVVAAYRGGRMDKAGEELRAKWKVEITPDVGSLCRRVDRLLIGSGSIENVKAAAAAGKPMFLMSPLAAKVEDARAIVKLVTGSGAPWFSASGVRFGEIAEIRSSYILGATTWGPGPLDPRAVDMLYALMGRGCEEITYAGDLVAGRWPGGRTGGVRAGDGLGVEVLRSKDARRKYKIGRDYRSLLVEVVKFFESGEPPVSSDETLEILSFLEAAQQSKAAGGAPVKLR
jgi:hypothetical protein